MKLLFSKVYDFFCFFNIDYFLNIDFELLFVCPIESALNCLTLHFSHLLKHKPLWEMQIMENAWRFLKVWKQNQKHF